MSECLLDTSAILEFFAGTERGAIVCETVENNGAAITIISIAEFSDIMTRKGRDARPQVAFIQQHMRILPISVEACIDAAMIKQSQRKRQSSFGLIDAIIYCTAQEHNLTLLTKDKDFAGLDGVKIL